MAAQLKCFTFCALCGLAMLGCGSGDDGGKKGPAASSDSGTTDDTVTAPDLPTVPTTSDTDTTTDTTSWTTTMDYDCDAPLPAPPLDVTHYGNFGGAEDFDFDDKGNHIAVARGDLLGRLFDGTTTVLAAGVSGETAGTRTLKNGDVVVASVATGSLVRIYVETGGSEVLLGGLSYPNGVEVSADGRYAFVSENGAGRIVQYDLDSGESWVIARSITGANGLALSPDQQTLFVGTCAGTGVIAIDRENDTDWTLSRYILDDPFGCYDAINVDICSNIYWSRFGSGEILRARPDGTDTTVLATIPGGAWVPNMRWGSGQGGWSNNILYALDRTAVDLVGLDTQVPGKRHIQNP